MLHSSLDDLVSLEYWNSHITFSVNAHVDEGFVTVHLWSANKMDTDELFILFSYYLIDFLIAAKSGTIRKLNSNYDAYL